MNGAYGKQYFNAPFFLISMILCVYVFVIFTYLHFFLQFTLILFCLKHLPLG